MRIILVIFTSLLTMSAFAKGAPLKPTDIFQFSCVTGTPSTSFFGGIEGNHLRVRVVHHHGVKYLPLHTGVVTPSDLDDLRTLADQMMNLGDEIEVKFPLSECQFFGSAIFVCHKGGTISKNGIDYQVFAINSSYTTDYFQQFEFERREMMLSFYVNGKHRAIAMRYDPPNCAFQNEPPQNSELVHNPRPK